MREEEEEEAGGISGCACTLACVSPTDLCPVKLSAPGSCTACRCPFGHVVRAQPALAGDTSVWCVECRRHKRAIVAKTSRESFSQQLWGLGGALRAVVVVEVEVVVGSGVTRLHDDGLYSVYCRLS